MKRTPAVLITLLFALSAIWTAVNDYQTQCRRIADDLTQALCLTVADQPEDWLSGDTIRTYRQHLRLDFLRESAVLSLCMREDDKASERGVSGERINIKQDISAYGNVSLSAWEIWWMADHRLSLLLTLLTLVMMSVSLRPIAKAKSIPSALTLTNGRFLDGFGQELHLTPMQRQLMEMFLSSPTHELSKEEICEALWPRKDDASDTLYALISRLKGVVESQTSLRITSERGRAYRLTGLETEKTVASR